MAKVELTKFKANTARKIGQKGTSVTRETIRDAAGNRQTVHTIDGNSSTFAADLTYVFGRNVAKARQENKRVAGVPDFEPAKR